jgi:hypothetical protein
LFFESAIKLRPMKKISFLLLSSLLLSCGMPSKSSLTYEESGNQSLNPDMQVTYGMIKSEILAAKCINCHSSAGTEEGLKEWITPGKPNQSPFFTKVENGTMPKNGSPLSTKDLELIKIYIEQMVASAPPATSPTPAPTPNPGTNTGISYSEIRATILEPYRCVSCHSVGTEAKLAGWINKTNPSMSKFYTMTKSGAMPEDGPRVSSEDLSFILQYVKDYSKRN